jgi:hypothetical protein
MKSFTFVSAAAIALVCATAFADGFTPTPVPVLGAPVGQPTPVVPMPEAGPAPIAGEPLFKCVRVKDPCHKAPCAVPMIVHVKDPCACKDPCNCCAPVKCVAVQICVPKQCPCDCPPKITCKKDGSYVKYDFGKYAVEITSNSKKGEVVVDYDH